MNDDHRAAQRGVLRAVGVIGAATLASRVLGFARDMVVARAFGAGPVAIWLIAHLKARTGDLELLFLGLAVTGILVWLVALMLPSSDDAPDRTIIAPNPAPAE